MVLCIDSLWLSKSHVRFLNARPCIDAENVCFACAMYVCLSAYMYVYLLLILHWIYFSPQHIFSCAHYCLHIFFATSRSIVVCFLLFLSFQQHRQSTRQRRGPVFFTCWAIQKSFVAHLSEVSVSVWRTAYINKFKKDRMNEWNAFLPPNIRIYQDHYYGILSGIRQCAELALATRTLTWFNSTATEQKMNQQQQQRRQ